MFLKTLLKQNTKLIDAAISFWYQGKIYPDSYVIDVEQTEANARLLLQAAHHHQVKLYLMSKQFGRNPELCRRLLAGCWLAVIRAPIITVWWRWILKKLDSSIATPFLLLILAIWCNPPLAC